MNAADQNDSIRTPNDQNHSINRSDTIKIKYTSTAENKKEEIEILLSENSDIGAKIIGLFQKINTPLSGIREEITKSEETFVQNEEVHTEIPKMDESNEKISSSTTNINGEVPYVWIQSSKKFFVELEQDKKKVSTLRKKFENLGFPKQVMNHKKDEQTSNKSELSKSPDFEKNTQKHVESNYLTNLEHEDFFSKCNENKTNFSDANPSTSTVFEETESSIRDLKEISKLLYFETSESNEYLNTSQSIETSSQTEQLNTSQSIENNSQTERDVQQIKDFPLSEKKLKIFTQKIEQNSKRRTEKSRKRKFDSNSPTLLFSKNSELVDVGKIYEKEEAAPLPENTNMLSLVYIKDLDKNAENKKSKFFKNIFKRKNKSKTLSQSQGPIKIFNEQALQVDNVNRLPSSKKTIVEYHLKTPLPLDDRNKMFKKYMVKILLDKKGHAGDLTDKSKAVFYVKSDKEDNSEGVTSVSSTIGIPLLDKSSKSKKPIEYSLTKVIRENSVSKIYKNRALMGPKRHVQETS